MTDMGPGAVVALGRWSASVDLFARLAPKLTVVSVVVSGVLSRVAFGNPFTCLRRREEDRRWLASNLQMLVPELRNVSPRVTVRPHIRARAGEAISTVVLLEVRRLIERHTEDRKLTYKVDKNSHWISSISGIASLISEQLPYAPSG